MTRRTLLYAALVVFFLLHNDLWLWDDGRLIAGIPVGLAYHIAYCYAAAALMAALVHWAWPHLGGDDEPSGAGARSRR